MIAIKKIKVGDILRDRADIEVLGGIQVLNHEELVR